MNDYNPFKFPSCYKLILLLVGWGKDKIDMCVKSVIWIFTEIIILNILMQSWQIWKIHHSYLYKFGSKYFAIDVYSQWQEPTQYLHFC